MRTAPKYIVGVGASAGGLISFKDLLDYLPSNTGMAFVFAAHILPDATSYLADILSRHTKMSTTIAASGMEIRANQVYVSTPNTDILIENYKFRVITPRIKRNVLLDNLLTSLAESMGAGAIGIVLSGYGADGTAGCKQIKEKGGITFAQDSSAEVGQMPRSAQAAGFIDFVLSPCKISEELARIAKASR